MKTGYPLSSQQFASNPSDRELQAELPCDIDNNVESDDANTYVMIEKYCHYCQAAARHQKLWFSQTWRIWQVARETTYWDPQYFANSIPDSCVVKSVAERQSWNIFPGSRIQKKAPNSGILNFWSNLTRWHHRVILGPVWGSIKSVESTTRYHHIFSIYIYYHILSISLVRHHLYLSDSLVIIWNMSTLILVLTSWVDPHCVPEPCAQKDAIESNQGAIHTEANGTGLWQEQEDTVLSPFNVSVPRLTVWLMNFKIYKHIEQKLFNSTQIHSSQLYQLYQNLLRIFRYPIGDLDRMQCQCWGPISLN